MRGCLALSPSERVAAAPRWWSCLHTHLGESCPGTGYREETRDCGWASLCQALSGRGRCGHFIYPPVRGTFPAGARGAGAGVGAGGIFTGLFLCQQSFSSLKERRHYSWPDRVNGGEDGQGKKRAPNWQVKASGNPGEGGAERDSPGREVHQGRAPE